MERSVKRVASAVLRTLFVYSTMVAIYLMVNSITHPATMAMPLTHVLSWPTEGCALVAALLLSATSFFVLRVLAHLSKSSDGVGRA